MNLGLSWKDDGLEQSLKVRRKDPPQKNGRQIEKEKNNMSEKREKGE